jgi:hypothetical protein
MPTIIDVSYSCGGQAGYLAGAGVKTVIRYYSRDTGVPQKRLSQQEAKSFAAAGIRLGVVHEAKHGDQIVSFTQQLGALDCAYAREYGAKIISQPSGSAIYFGVDIDASATQIQDCVIPYFKGIASAMATPNGLLSYQIGIYGSGAACDAILSAGLAQYSWLAQSKGWQGYKTFLQSKRWSLLQSMPSSVGEIGCDPNTPNGDFGDFFLSEVSTTVATAPLTATARPGLRLRAGPGTDFDILNLLPIGTKIYPLKTVGDWTQVDLTGDNAADGFVNSHFLSS